MTLPIYLFTWSLCPMWDSQPKDQVSCAPLTEWVRHPPKCWLKILKQIWNYVLVQCYKQEPSARGSCKTQANSIRVTGKLFWDEDLLGPTTRYFESTEVEWDLGICMILDSQMFVSSTGGMHWPSAQGTLWEVLRCFRPIEEMAYSKSSVWVRILTGNRWHTRIR